MALEASFRCGWIEWICAGEGCEEVVGAKEQVTSALLKSRIDVAFQSVSPPTFGFKMAYLTLCINQHIHRVKSDRSSARAGPPGPAFQIQNSPLLELGRKVWLVGHPLAPMLDLDLEKIPGAAPLVAQGSVTMLTQTLELAAADYSGGGQCEGTFSYSGRLLMYPQHPLACSTSGLID